MSDQYQDYNNQNCNSFLSYLFETKKHIHKELTFYLKNYIQLSFEKLYEQSSLINNKEALKIFQLSLCRLPILTYSMIENDYSQLKTHLMPDNIKQIKQHIAHLCELHAMIKYLKKYHKFPDHRLNFVLLPAKDFLHRCYIYIGRKLWSVPEIISHKYSTNQIHKNQEQFQQTIIDGIEDVIKDFIPIEDLYRCVTDCFYENKINNILHDNIPTIEIKNSDKCEQLNNESNRDFQIKFKAEPISNSNPDSNPSSNPEPNLNLKSELEIKPKLETYLYPNIETEQNGKGNQSQPKIVSKEKKLKISILNDHSKKLKISRINHFQIIKPKHKVKVKVKLNPKSSIPAIVSEIGCFKSPHLKIHNSLQILDKISSNCSDKFKLNSECIDLTAQNPEIEMLPSKSKLPSMPNNNNQNDKISSKSPKHITQPQLGQLHIDNQEKTSRQKKSLTSDSHIFTNNYQISNDEFLWPKVDSSKNNLHNNNNILDQTETIDCDTADTDLNVVNKLMGLDMNPKTLLQFGNLPEIKNFNHSEIDMFCQQYNQNISQSNE